MDLLTTSCIRLSNSTESLYDRLQTGAAHWRRVEKWELVMDEWGRVGVGGVGVGGIGGSIEDVEGIHIDRMVRKDED